MAYTNTFITTSPDSKAEQAKIPTAYRGKKTMHQLQYELLTEKPYHYGHKDLIFAIYLIRKELEDISEQEKAEIWEELFSKGQPCLRASALVKKYGFGAHYNKDGKIALYSVESSEYKDFVANETIKKFAGMKSKR